MRLLFITQDFPPETGGIQTYSFELSKRLAIHSDYFCVLAPKTSRTEKFDQKLTFNIRRFKVSNTLLFIVLLFRLSGIIKKNKIDIVFHAQWQTLLPSIWVKKRGLINKIAVGAHARELLFNPFGKGWAGSLYEKYKLTLMKHVDVWYPVSEYTAGLLQNNGVEKKKIEVLINGTNPEQYYPKDASAFKNNAGLGENKVILTVTRLVARKGIDLVIQAMPEVLKEIPNAFYLIVGDGPIKEQLQQQITNSNLSMNVKLVGRVEYHSMIDYYNIADVFVMPSKTVLPDVEGFGIVFLEANACAKPVIGSNSGGIPSAIKHGYNGLIVNENDIEGLTKAIIKILKNDHFATKLGENGLEFVREIANWDAVVKKLHQDLKDKIH